MDDREHLVGLITVKDIEKAVATPNATKDAEGRLRAAAATTVGDAGFARSEALIDAGCDCIVIDTAHGHNTEVARAVERVKSLSNSVQVVAGNVATGDAAKALADAGADAVKVGIGPGSICTTRVIAGVGGATYGDHVGRQCIEWTQRPGHRRRRNPDQRRIAKALAAGPRQ